MTYNSRLNAERSIKQQQEAETIQTAFNAELITAVGVLIPHIDAYASELRNREGRTDPGTTALLTTYCQMETLYLQLMKERKSSKWRQSRSR